MRAGIIVIVSMVARVALAEGADPVPVHRETRLAGMTLGGGSSVPGLGISAEKYLREGRVSFFGGVGYIPHSQDGRGAAGTGVAGGLRAYSRGRVHRAFVEASFSPVAVEVAPEGSSVSGEKFSYGPGVSVGYSMVRQSGFTVMVSAGAGQGVTGPSDLHSTQFLSTIAVGHTWVRRQPRSVRGGPRSGADRRGAVGAEWKHHSRPRHREQGQGRAPLAAYPRCSTTDGRSRDGAQRFARTSWSRLVPTGIIRPCSSRSLARSARSRRSQSAVRSASLPA